MVYLCDIIKNNVEKEDILVFPDCLQELFPRGCFNPLPHDPNEEAYENIVGKGKMLITSLLPKKFSTHVTTNYMYIIPTLSYVSSANVFNLDHNKVLSFGKGLTLPN